MRLIGVAKRHGAASRRDAPASMASIKPWRARQPYRRDSPKPDVNSTLWCIFHELPGSAASGPEICAPLRMRSNAYHGRIVAEDCPIVSLSLIWDNGTGGHY